MVNFISQLASLIETILTQHVGRSFYSNCYFCWLLQVVVEVALAHKIQVQIWVIFGSVYKYGQSEATR